VKTSPDIPPTESLKKRGRLYDVLLLLTLSSALFFPGLGDAPLFDDDETRFASVAREMVQSGDWVVPRFNGEIADKPPLLFWTMAAAFSMLGETPAAARFGSAAFSLVAVLTLWWLASRIFDREVGRWSALGLATCLLFVAEARLATTDAALLVLVSLVFALAIGGWWDGKGGIRTVAAGLVPLTVPRAATIGFVGGLGVLCKGPAAILLPLLSLWLFACCMSFGRNKENFFLLLLRSLASLRPLGLAFGVLVAAAPWHVAVWQPGGEEWFQIFYGQHYLGRLALLAPLTGVAMLPPSGHGGFPFFQVVSLFGGLFPWSVFLPLAAWRTFRGGLSSAPTFSAARVFVSLWLLVWVAAVSFSSTQLPHYSFPAYPAACMMIASLLVSALRSPAGLSDGWLYAAAAGLLAGALVLVFAVLAGAHLLDLPALAPFALIGVIPALTAGVFAVAVHRGARRIAASVFLTGTILLQWSIFHFALPALEFSGGAMRAVAKVGEILPGEKRWASYRYSSPGVVWASGGRVQTCRSAADVAAFLQSGRGNFAFVSTDAFEEVASALDSPPSVVYRWRPPERRSDTVLLGSAP